MSKRWVEYFGKRVKEKNLIEYAVGHSNSKKRGLRISLPSGTEISRRNSTHSLDIACRSAHTEFCKITSLTLQVSVVQENRDSSSDEI